MTSKFGGLLLNTMDTGGAGRRPETPWRAALLAGLTVFVFFLTIYCLNRGIQTVFTHIYYVPIILAAYWYQKKGVLFSAVLGLLYLSCVISFAGYNPIYVVSAAARAIVFVIIAAIVMVLSMRISRQGCEIGQSEERFRNIWDNIQAGIILVDAETHEILAVNPEAERLTGFTGNELIGQPCHRIICPAEKGSCPVSDQGMAVDRSERILLTKGGEPVPVLKTVRTAMIDGRNVLIENFIRREGPGSTRTEE